MKMFAVVIRYRCKRCGYSYTNNAAYEAHREACRGTGDGG